MSLTWIRRWAIGLAALGAMGDGAPAQEISAALRDRVAQLVDRLESEDGDERDQAEEALVKLGARILPLLPEADEDSGDDLRERLSRIRASLEGGASEKNLGASLVTIVGEGIRLSEVLQELQRQSGNRISDLRELYGQDATNPALDLQLEEMPFLEALDRVAAQAGLTTAFFTGDETIGLLAGGAMGEEMAEEGGEAPTVYTGPFRVTLNQVASQHDLATGTRSANAQMVLVWEPRLRPMLLTLDVSDVEIVDDRGEAVEPTVTEESGTVVLRPENPAAEMNLNMTAPDRSAQKLGRLKVRATVTVPAANQVFRLDLAGADAKEERGPVSIAVGDVEVDGFVWKVDVGIEYEGGSEAFESYRQGLFNNRIWLQRPDGSRFEHNGGFNQLGASDNAMAFEYLFVDAPGEPSDYQLVYETPGAVATIPLEFEFTDVPLP
ncbi:hypothetical protein [Tautonia plasticadhaerens]|uniref:Uncharacterized protein n=1 Tax=Tautonia plasticadhaerens TaxID=2527974 RepID=A0A518GXN2_9BACT|nr:hypothetical protein [Tautonia plasticadhaerens]QDV33358.1 hypothetical protein ElP_12290 [Tautonia plasticadhaerens]